MEADCSFRGHGSDMSAVMSVESAGLEKSCQWPQSTVTSVGLVLLCFPVFPQPRFPE